MEIVLATNNEHKVRECCEILAPFGIVVRALTEFENVPEVIEDGDTFEANAIKKAEEISAFTNTWAIADDSGLEVDALNGAPGVHSARYAGESATTKDNNAKLQNAMRDVKAEDATARYRCVMALARRGEKTLTFSGAVEGRIVKSPVGSGGFGYDPYFYYPPFETTFANVSGEKKHAVSHRGEALSSLVKTLKELI